MDREDVLALLDEWADAEVEIILSGRESRSWLARFAGTLGTNDGGSTYEVHIGGPEAWVVAIPMTFEDASQSSEDILTVRHRDGQITIRKAIPIQ